MSVTPITTGEQMLFAEKELYDEEVMDEEARLRRGGYRQRYDGTVVREGEDDYEAVDKPDRDFVPRAGQNYVEDRVIAQIDRRRRRNEREMRAMQGEAPMPRVQKLYRSLAELEAAEAAKRSEVEETWKQVTSPAYRDRWAGRGLIRRRSLQTRVA